MYFILSSFNYSNKRLDHGNMLFYQSSGSSLHLYMFPHILDWRISPHCWQIGRKNLCRKQDSGKSNCWANDGGAFHCFSSKFIHLYNRNCLIGVQWWWVVHLILLYQMSIDCIITYCLTKVINFLCFTVIDVRTAIPMIMGSNIGTSMTSTLVSLTHMTHAEAVGYIHSFLGF